MSPRFDYDLTIVGASFTGLVAARTAAMRGLRVAVIEAKKEAGARVRTTGILVKEAVEEIDIPHELTRRIHGVRLYSPRLDHTDLFAPGYYFLSTNTADLLRWFARQAENCGVDFYYDSRFRDAVRIENGIQISGLNITTRYLIGADGAQSRVARCFGLGRVKHCLTGVEWEYAVPKNISPPYLHCFLDSQLAPGYMGWVVPGPEFVQVGIAVKESCKPDLNNFVAKVDPLFKISHHEIVEKRAGRIPSSGLVKRFSCPNVMLIGDSAGMVSPLTGGGIRLAFRFGRRAAQTISDYLLDRGPSPETVLSHELPWFGAKSFMRKTLELSPPNFLLNNLLLRKPVIKLAQQVYFHRRGAGGVRFQDFQNEIERTQQPRIVNGEN
ncbi:MAG: NAD(P)/FAD-dependent oxidoreductase [Methyloligellaceae bacterium]